SGKLVPLDEFRRNLQAMIDRARAAKVETIVLVTMNPIIPEYWRLRHPGHPQRDQIRAHMAKYDSAIRKVAEKNVLPIADLRRLVEEHGGATTAASSLIRNEASAKSKDGVHLREEGYRLMAELFVPILRDKVKAGDVVVCLGDSLTAAKNGYCRYLSAYLNNTCDCPLSRARIEIWPGATPVLR
ncbi:MAG: hypothetical protein HQ582_10075, partial [Planctomycetes bacterium]|nr:hypothetical protein [Planctomycetota bacterium]